MMAGGFQPSDIYIYIYTYITGMNVKFIWFHKYGVINMVYIVYIHMVGHLTIHTINGPFSMGLYMNGMNIKCLNVMTSINVLNVK